MKMWETKCSKCGSMIPANQCPQVGCYVPSENKYKNSLCKPCWEKLNFRRRIMDKIDKMDKIDTQGMSLPGRSKKPNSYEPMPVKVRTIFTPEERMELKQIIHEVLDERERL